MLRFQVESWMWRLHPLIVVAFPDQLVGWWHTVKWTTLKKKGFELLVNDYDGSVIVGRQ